jgi:hypothetical protein
MYVAKPNNWSNHRCAVLQSSNQSKRISQLSLKDVEKAHVRDDSLLRGRGRPEGRERNIWRNAVKLQ